MNIILKDEIKGAQKSEVEPEGAERTNILSGPFQSFPHVGRGVGQSLTHILTHTVFPQKVTKSAKIIRFLPVYGAGNVT